MHRAEKSGFAAEAQKKIHEKYDEQLAAEILMWVQQNSGKTFATDGSVTNFCSVLKDGTVLCSLANQLKPGCISKVNESKMAFKQMENINFFLEKFVNGVCNIAKPEQFQTVDLFEGQDPNSVVVCLMAIARKADRLFGVAGLGPKEATGHRREFTEEQLRAGEGVIGLQAGSNKGASQSGQNFGLTRHM